MNLGATLGKVTAGSHTTAGFKEDKRNKATPGKGHLGLLIPFILRVAGITRPPFSIFSRMPNFYNTFT